MAVSDLNDWLGECLASGTIWYLKRFAANDTLANHSHQAGPYIPKDLLFELFPAIHDPAVHNPRVEFDAYIDSHADHRRVTAIWYNNRVRDAGTRNETRITNWGGVSSAVLDPDSTGALAAFVFRKSSATAPLELHIWVCRHETEEDLIEERVAPVEPGGHVIWRPGEADMRRILDAAAGRGITCRLTPRRCRPAGSRRSPQGLRLFARSANSGRMMALHRMSG
jgi:hypothetical protein